MKKSNIPFPEDIEKTLAEIFYAKIPEPRSVVMCAYCSGRDQMIDYADLGNELCDDSKCDNCRQIREFIDEINKV
jgi:hypothetical protein